MKAGKSSATAMVLPSFATYCLVVSNVASSVAMPRMSSTSSMSGTGFMKWMPMKRSGRSVEEASRVIAIAQGFERLRRRDAFECSLPLFLCDALAAHLPRHVAVNRRNPGLDPVGGKVVELDVESGERADMGDAVTHLSRPDHADLAD